MQVVISSSDPVCPVGYINFTKMKLVPKNQTAKMAPRTSLDFIQNLSDNDEEVLPSPDDEIDMDGIRDLTNNAQSKDETDNHEFTKDGSLENGQLVPVRNALTSVENSRGWLWVAGLQSSNSSPRGAITELLQALEECLGRHSFTLRDLVRITLYIESMADYAEINAAYVEALNFTNPPTRICVELKMPSDCRLIVEAIAHKYPPNGSMTDVSLKRSTLHIQGISHWAPANIGPYSQSIGVRFLSRVPLEHFDHSRLAISHMFPDKLLWYLAR